MKRAPNPKTSTLEAAFDQAWRLLRPAWAPMPVNEYRFAPPRRWRFDRCFIDERVAVELEGGTFARGRHQRPQGFINDCEKYNAAGLAGWLVLRFTGSDLKLRPDRVVEQVAAALRVRADRITPQHMEIKDEQENRRQRRQADRRQHARYAFRD